MAHDGHESARQLTRWSAVAQTLTVAVALVMGLIMVVGLLADDLPSWVDSLNSALVVLVSIGGASMGLLYLVRRQGARDEEL